MSLCKRASWARGRFLVCGNYPPAHCNNQSWLVDSRIFTKADLCSEAEYGLFPPACHKGYSSSILHLRSPSVSWSCDDWLPIVTRQASVVPLTRNKSSRGESRRWVHIQVLRTWAAVHQLLGWLSPSTTWVNFDQPDDLVSKSGALTRASMRLFS